MATQRKTNTNPIELKRIHKQLSNAATQKRDEVLTTLGLSSLKTFYEILDGKRPCSIAERDAIAKIYNTPAAQLFKALPKKSANSKRKPVK